MNAASDPCVVRGVPLPPVPSALRRKFILLRSPSLLKLLTTSRPSDLSAGPTPWGFVPFDDVALASPVWSGIPTPLRFRSQVLSTSQRFPGRPEFRGLLSSRCRPWVSPFRVFPSQESRAPLEAALLPCGHPPACWTPPPGSFTVGFPDAHAFARLPGSPDDYRLPFHAPKHASRSPWTQATVIDRSASFTHFEALILLRVRSRQPGLPQTDGRSSPGLLPP